MYKTQRLNNTKMTDRALKQESLYVKFLHVDHALSSAAICAEYFEKKKEKDLQVVFVLHNRFQWNSIWTLNIIIAEFKIYKNKCTTELKMKKHPFVHKQCSILAIENMILDSKIKLGLLQHDLHLDIKYSLTMSRHLRPMHRHCRRKGNLNVKEKENDIVREHSLFKILLNLKTLIEWMHSQSWKSPSLEGVP